MVGNYLKCVLTIIIMHFSNEYILFSELMFAEKKYIHKHDYKKMYCFYGR